MASRMDRYNKSEDNKVSSRLERNKNKYDDFKNVTYTKISSTGEIQLPTSLIDGELNKTYSKKEDNDLQREERQVLSQFLKDEEKSYDINKVLEEARENRNKNDELDGKRKLRSSEFNILEGLDQEQLEKIKQKKKELYREGEDGNIEELINTITSNSLSNKVNEKLKEESSDELLSDLLPDRIDETIITEAISDEQIENYEPLEESDKEELDTSFYTKSMDLNDEDLVKEVSEDEEEDFSFVDNKSSHLFLKVFLFILLLAIIIAIVFYLYTKIN